jgi:hypothetical protein
VRELLANSQRQKKLSRQELAKKEFQTEVFRERRGPALQSGLESQPLSGLHIPFLFGRSLRSSLSGEHLMGLSMYLLLTFYEIENHYDGCHCCEGIGTGFHSFVTVTIII